MHDFTWLEIIICRTGRTTLDVAVQPLAAGLEFILNTFDMSPTLG